jgi:uncharacterized protein involved in exopolysaccharide biosynthesis
MAYLKFAPILYKSEFTLILPRTDSKTIADIEGVGQISSSRESIYGTELADPRTDYKYIIESPAFLSSVAKSLKISVEELGVPRTKAVDNSSILTVEIKGSSAEDALIKGSAIYKIFTQTVDQLRQEEKLLRTNNSQDNLIKTSENLKLAQEKLVSFQTRSGFNSPEQINLLGASIEEIRRTKAQVDAEHSSVDQNFRALSNSLNLTSQNAVQAFTLKADRLFQLTLQEYVDATNRLAILTEKLEENHPEVVKESFRQQAATDKLNQRGKQLIGESFNVSLLKLLNLSESNPVGRESLYENLISLNAQRTSLLAKSKELQKKMDNFQQLYIQQIKYRETYEILSRDLRIAETFFSSNVATTKGKDVNSFASYPLFQMLTPPSLPLKPSSPKKTFAFLGAGLGSILVSSGIGLLWFRSSQIEKKNINSSNFSTTSKILTEEMEETKETNLNGTLKN